MSHQRRPALVAAIVGGAGALAVGLLATWGPIAPVAPEPARQLHDLGIELMTRSMLIFETAGLSILLAMVVASALAIVRRG